MLENLLVVKNFYWAGESYTPCIDPVSPTHTLRDLRGQFSFAFQAPEGKILLVRDRLGINKLFFAIHKSGKVVAANYLVHLIEKGVPMEAIYSVPSGHFLLIDAGRRSVSLTRYAEPEWKPALANHPLDEIARDLRHHLEFWFSKLAEQFSSKRIFLCLSGGLDSGLVAALARKHFPDVTGYTYGYMQEGRLQSEDAEYAQRLAQHLGIPWRFVPATSSDILDSLENALCYGQDWRDFNVHCAIVNEILGRAIERDVRESGCDKQPLLLSGDLMNEFLADYTPVHYAGQEFYSLPKLEFGALRSVLVRGLDSGDREIGVFNHHGLDIIQPYGLLMEQYLRLPNALVREENSKQNLVRAVAGDLLPPFIFERKKVRAQIGNSKKPSGILPVLLESGRNSAWLKKTFCERFAIKDSVFLNRFILMGLYRFMSDFPEERNPQCGFYT